MKTKIRKITAAFLLALLCLTAVPAAAFAAETAENTGLAVDVAIPVSVELSGEAPSPAESFVLTLQALDNAPLPAEHTLTITGAGTASFPAITYTAPGIYYYTVTQQAGSHARGHYDSAVYYVRVSVTNAENGGLEAVVAAHTDAQMVSAKRDITFTNTYDPVPAATTEQPSNPATQPSDQDSSSDDNAGIKFRNHKEKLRYQRRQDRRQQQSVIMDEPSRTCGQRTCRHRRRQLPEVAEPPKRIVE